MNRLRKAGALTLLGAATCAALTMPVAAAEPDTTPAPGPVATAEPAEPVTPAPAEPVAEPVTAEPATPLGPEPVTPAPAPVDGDCSAAGLSETVSSVMAKTSAYLKAHPDVNQALLDATKQPAFMAMGQMDGFFNDHPAEADEVRAIQQPARDYQARCGMVVEPAEAFMALQGV